MNKTAYCILFINKNTHKVEQYGIFSEFPVTSLGPEPSIQVCIFERTSFDYDSAYKKVQEHLKARHRWLRKVKTYR